MPRKSKSVSFVLVISMVLSLFSGTFPLRNQEALAEASPPANGRTELTEYRTQNSKRFRNPDGSLTEEVYSGSVHYFDQSSQQWQEIDTSLIPDDADPNAFVTKANRFRAQIARTSGGGQFLKVDDGQREVRLLPVEMGNVASSVKGKKASFIGAMHATDVEYTFGRDQVKEEITLYSTSAARGVWSSKVETKGLRPQEKDDGSIVFYDEKNKPIMVMPRPFAFDATGASVLGSLKLRKQGEAVFVDLSIDKTWLLDSARRYPVVVDPTIYNNGYGENLKDSFVASGNPNYMGYFGYNYLEVGNDAAIGHTRSYIWMNLPSLPSSAWIDSARLTLTEYTGNTQSTAVDVYRVTSDSDSKTVTWNNQPTVPTIKESTTTVSGAGAKSWDVSSLVQDWYFYGQPNYGFMLRYADENASYRRFRSADYTVNPCEWPTLSITYRVDPLGWEKFWGYAGNMNVANGNMVLSATDTAVPSRGLTASITRTFNSRSSYVGPFGYGWTSELDMRLNIPATPSGVPKGPIAYIDLDRTVHYFKQEPDGSYTSPSGLYLTLTRNANGTYCVTEKDGLVYTFSSAGGILSLADTNGNTISYTYSGSQVTKITDPANRSITLAWNGGKITSITNQANIQTTYQYDAAGNLIQVTNAANRTAPYIVKYSYDSGHHLRAITPPSGGKTYFHYTADNRLESISSVNAIENASFEVDGDGNGIPDYWTPYGAANSSFSTVTVPKPTLGSKAFAVSLAAPNTSTNSYGVYTSQPIPVSSATEYHLTGWVQATQTAGTQNTIISLLAYDAAGNYLNEYARILKAGPLATWTAVTYDLAANTLPTNVATVRVKVGANNMGGKGNSYFDGVQLEEGPNATSFVAPTTYTVDPFNLAAAVYDGNGKKQKWTYNDSGNPLTVTDDPSGLNYQSQYSWVADKPNLLGTFKDANAVKNGTAATTYTYDGSGNLLSAKDPLGNTSKYTYNSLNDLVSYADPKAVEANQGDPTPQVKLTYDGQRNPAAAVDRKGVARAQNVDRTNCKGCTLSETAPLSTLDNLLTNPSFERSATGYWPDGWRPPGDTGNYESTKVFSGNKAIKLSPAVGGARVEVVHDADIPVTAGKIYTLSLYVSATTPELARKAQGRIDFYDVNGTQLAGSAFTNLQDTTDWSRVMVSATAPAGAVKARVVLYASPGTASGSAYFDAVQLEAAPFVSAFNLLDNAGFERGGTKPDTWNSDVPGAYEYSTIAIAGGKSVSITDPGQTTIFWPEYFVPYNRSKPLTLSAFAGTVDLQGGVAYVKLGLYDANKTYRGNIISKSLLSGNTSWSRIYVQVSANPSTAVVPDGIAYVKPMLVVEGPSTGMAFFDAVRLEQALMATEYAYGTSGLAAFNNWVTKVTNPHGDYVSYEYDAAGFVTKVTPNGDSTRSVSYTPDDLERLKSVGLPNGLTTNYSYTPNGAISSIEHVWTEGSVKSAVTSFRYDLRDLLVEVTDPLNRKTAFDYDSAGNLTKVTKPSGTVATFGYNAANRLVQRSIPGKTFTFGYDPNGNLTSAKHTVGGVSSTWTYTYDRINRLTQGNNLVGGATYEYDANSLLTRRNATDGSLTNSDSFVYDEANQLLRVENTDWSKTRELVRFGYNEQGQVVKTVVGNQFYAASQYDDLGRLQQLENRKLDGQLLNSYRYDYDQWGNRSSETVTSGGTTTTRTFAYDKVGQLVSDGTYTYEYTPRGNRQSRTGSGTTTFYCYDQADQLVYAGANQNPCSQTANITYDQNGNMIRNASGANLWEHQYDAENRLVLVKKNGSQVAAYTYDALGRRASKTASGVTRTYHYDGLSNRVLYETEGSMVAVWYQWAGDRLIATKQNGGKIYYYQYNAHGDVVALYDEQGSAVETYTYDVWGVPQINKTDPGVRNEYPSVSI